MTMTIAIESRTAETPARSEPGRIAHLDIVTNLESAKTTWGKLDLAAAL
jgi:hypothetical protein